MADVSTAYRGRVAALTGKLDSPNAATERDVIRAELISIGKGLEQDLAELTALREEAKTLVDRWKALQGTASPAFNADRPVVVDHIGASTFIEKGWSRISLGDYRRRGVESLTKALQLVPNDPQCGITASAGPRCFRRSTTTR